MSAPMTTIETVTITRPLKVCIYEFMVIYFHLILRKIAVSISRAYSLECFNIFVESLISYKLFGSVKLADFLVVLLLLLSCFLYVSVCVTDTEFSRNWPIAICSCEMQICFIEMTAFVGISNYSKICAFFSLTQNLCHPSKSHGKSRASIGFSLECLYREPIIYRCDMATYREHSKFYKGKLNL